MRTQILTSFIHRWFFPTSLQENACTSITVQARVICVQAYARAYSIHVDHLLDIHTA